jgi:hypothetical protein
MRQGDVTTKMSRAPSTIHNFLHLPSLHLPRQCASDASAHHCSAFRSAANPAMRAQAANVQRVTIAEHLVTARLMYNAARVKVCEHRKRLFCTPERVSETMLSGLKGLASVHLQRGLSTFILCSVRSKHHAHANVVVDRQRFERSCNRLANLMQLRATDDGTEPILLSSRRFRELPNQQPRRGLV